MTRKELYQKITELNLQEEVKKACGRNYTQASNSVLEAVIAKAGVKKEESKASKKPEVTKAPAKSPKCECQNKKQSSDETKLDKLIKLLVKRRILLNSEVELIMN